MRQIFATVIIEPNGLIREGLARILRASRFRIVVVEPALDDIVLNALSKQRDILLIIGSGDDHHAMIEQIELFKASKPDGRVAVVTDRQHPSEALAAFRAGVNAYFARGTTSDAFIKSLDLVLLGETLMPATLLTLFPCREQADDAPFNASEALARSDDIPQFSAQEKRILRNLIEGDSNKVIARKVGIAEATVKVHVKAILRKLRLHNRTQAAVWAMNSGSFDPAVSTGLEILVSRMSKPVPFAELPGPSANRVLSG
ncbi:MAG: response regulator transcription factor [Roseiarcus sp.]